METIVHILLIWFLISIPISLIAGFFLSMSKHPAGDEDDIAGYEGYEDYYAPRSVEKYTDQRAKQAEGIYKPVKPFSSMTLHELDDAKKVTSQTLSKN